MRTLIICAGLAGVGKTTHIESLVKKIPNSVYVDKDTICNAMMQDQEDKSWDTKHFKDNVRIQSYRVMTAIAKSNLTQEKTVILEGNFGDKLMLPLMQDLLKDLQDVTVKVIYFHCRGDQQLYRLWERGESRNAAKLVEGSFLPYRLESIKQHLPHLAQVPHLMVDTEQEVEPNVDAIIKYVPQPTVGIDSYNEAFVAALTYDQAMQGAAEFSQLLIRTKCPASREGEIIPSSKDFTQQAKKFSALPLAKQQDEFTPFEIARDFRRNVEIDFYFAQAKALIESADTSQDPYFLQKLSFAYLQKGLHKEAQAFLSQAHMLATEVRDVSPLFMARQTQIQGPLLREQGADPSDAIAVLKEGLVQCEKSTPDQAESFNLVKINLLRDLALCHLKAKDFAQALAVFKLCLETAQQTGFKLFCLPVRNYVALATTRLAEQRQNEGAHEEAKRLAEESTALFAKVNEQYREYSAFYQSLHDEDVLKDCQDWASHVFHFGISNCDKGLFKEAVEQLLAAKELRTALNLKGQLNNRVAEVCEWLAKAYSGLNDFVNASKYAEQALDIYQYKLQTPDKAAMERVVKIISAFPLDRARQDASVTGLGMFRVAAEPAQKPATKPIVDALVVEEKDKLPGSTVPTA